MFFQLKYYKNLYRNVNYLKLYSTKSNTKTNSYSKTVLLPSTKVPIRLENEKLVQRDKEINEINKHLYAWQGENLKNSEFVLHDGPPYANGSLHMGHAINKILKDTIIRSKIINGTKVSFVPGWDCHGLPIELKAIKQKNNETNTLPALEIRRKARNFAKQTIEKQKDGFISWGVLGDWNNAYKTFDKGYIKNQLRQFFKLYEKKLIFQEVKPVYWSPSSKTALAEAELEYKPDHKSTAVTLRLKTVNVPDLFSLYKNVFLLIWTTTPWSLPGNQAICYNKHLKYSLITENDHDHYIIASDLIKNHENLTGKTFRIKETVTGDLLENFTYSHPIFSNELKLIHSEHATNTKGTGLVHTAPAHGPEDFLIALEHKIKIMCLVNESGNYTEDAGDTLKNLDVLHGGMDKVLEMVSENIVHKDVYVHSYPYDWRTKEPVILRASLQWFLNIDAIKECALKELEDIEIIPKVNSEKYKRNLTEQIRKRPYWCISRQRSWGTPIPMFYKKSTGECLKLTEEVINHLNNIIDSSDEDFWWKLSVNDLLPKNFSNENNISPEDITKGEDILDIWFDSGISWSSVLPKPQIADMYLEGVDQFTGWFQSSLITSIALRGKPPYKTVYVHGFAVDENGLKMSKSVGNVVDPLEIMSKGCKGSKKPYGVDTLRWWVACHANQDATAHVSKNVLDACAQEVHKLRLSMRFALGSLGDYNEKQSINYENLLLVDKYILNELYNYKQKADDFIKEYQFNKLCALVLNFSTNELSSLYYTSIKDRLYCDSMDNLDRRSAQFVLYQIFWVLSRSIAPIIPHLVEELYKYLPQKTEDSFFMDERQKELSKEWKNCSIEEIMPFILKVKAEIHKEAGSKGVESLIEVHLHENDIKNLEKFTKLEELSDIFQVSEVKLIKNTENFEIKVRKTDKTKCPRCWKYNSIEDCLCSRCTKVVEGLTEEKQEISHL